MSELNIFENPFKALNSLLKTDDAIVPVGNVFSRSFMRTDVINKKDKYVLNVEVPSYDKKDINIELDKGYLTISAGKEIKQEEKDENDYMVKERYSSKIERSFYVGDSVKEKDITAKMDKGLLEISIKKPVKKEEEKTSITIN